jgi:acyl carrier protein/RimJ/RimL family protein N-acetyltransferase
MLTDPLPTSATLDFGSFVETVFEALGRAMPHDVHPDDELIGHLAFDSLELFEFQVVLEELCGAELPDELLAGIDTLGAAHHWYEVKRSQHGGRVDAPADRETANPRPGAVLTQTRRVRLRALAPPDYEWLYALTTRADNLVRWRDRGQTFRIEAWVDRLWAGVAAQFVVESAAGRPLGLVTVFNHDARNRHARLATIFDDRVSLPGWRLEGVGLLVNYAFEVFDLKKLYAEVVDFNYPAFESGLGRLFVEEGTLVDYEYAHGRFWPVHVLAIDRARFADFFDQWLPRSLGAGLIRDGSDRPTSP